MPDIIQDFIWEKHIRWYNGYGESFPDYNKYTSMPRMGLFAPVIFP
jgi:outer membrane phospholipase A